MKFDLLSQALIQNKDIISKGFTLPLCVKNLEHFEQTLFLDELFKEGTFVCKIDIPEKTTEPAHARFQWEGEGCYLSLGCLTLPSLRKPSSSSAMNKLIRRPTDLSGPIEGKLQYDNQSLLKYALSKIDPEVHIFLENGSWNKKPNTPIPEMYNSITKILALVNYKIKSE